MLSESKSELTIIKYFTFSILNHISLHACLKLYLPYPILFHLQSLHLHLLLEFHYFLSSNYGALYFLELLLIDVTIFTDWLKT